MYIKLILRSLPLISMKEITYQSKKDVVRVMYMVYSKKKNNYFVRRYVFQNTLREMDFNYIYQKLKIMFVFTIQHSYVRMSISKSPHKLHYRHICKYMDGKRKPIVIITFVCVCAFCWFFILTYQHVFFLLFD